MRPVFRLCLSVVFALAATLFVSSHATAEEQCGRSSVRRAVTAAAPRNLASRSNSEPPRQKLIHKAWCTYNVRAPGRSQSRSRAAAAICTPASSLPCPSPGEHRYAVQVCQRRSISDIEMQAWETFTHTVPEAVGPLTTLSFNVDAPGSDYKNRRAHGVRVQERLHRRQQLQGLGL